MSNEENMNLTDEPCDSIKLPAGWNESLPALSGYVLATSKEETWLRFGSDATGSFVVNGIDLGPVADLAALVRDARRFRKLEQAHDCNEANGRPTHGAIQLERWDAEWMDWVPLSNGPLAEIADALPEVEQN